MDNIPSLKSREAKFRAVTSSADYNDSQEETLYDILNLFNKVNFLEQDLADTKDIVDSESKYMQLKLQKLKAQMELLLQRNKDLERADSFFHKYIYPHQMYIDSKIDSSANIDLTNMDVTLPYVSATSKVNVYDDIAELTFIPPSLNIETVDIDSNKLLVPAENIVENDIKNAFDGQPYSYWRRKIYTDNNVDSITTTVIIGLPEDIISNRDINAVVIHPYPYGSMDLINVEYRMFGNWVPVPTFGQHSEAITEFYTDAFGVSKSRHVIPEISNIKISFKEITATEIRISFRQRNYIQENDKRVFYIGARDIQILSYKYNKESASFYSKVVFEEPGSKVIYDIKSLLNNKDEVGNNVIQYELYTLDEYDSPSKISSGFPFEISNNKLLIKCTLHKNKATPVLGKLQVIYKSL